VILPTNCLLRTPQHMNSAFTSYIWPQITISTQTTHPIRGSTRRQDSTLSPFHFAIHSIYTNSCDNIEDVCSTLAAEVSQAKALCPFYVPDSDFLMQMIKYSAKAVAQLSRLHNALSWDRCLSIQVNASCGIYVSPCLLYVQSTLSSTSILASPAQLGRQD